MRIPVNIRQASDGSQWISTRELTENIFGSQARTEADKVRKYFGSRIEVETIESAIRMAEQGYMRDLSDLIKETLNIDPHFATVTQKRFRALASVKPKVVAASGDGVDDGRANQYAEEVRSQLSSIKNLRQQITRLDWAHCNGRAALEKVWRETAAGYRIEELNWIHARRLSFGPNRELRVRDDGWGGGGFEARGLDIESIPHKFVTFKPQLFDEYPEREGFGPRALYYSFFKRLSWRQRMILIEVFGNPWRILEMAPGTPYTNDEQLDDMQERADQLGASSSAAFAPGVKLNLANADPKSVDAHDKTSDKCDDQISKLVLGSTRTVDAKPDGLGGQQSLVHQDGETLMIAADGWSLSDCLSWHIARDIVVVNHGEDEAVNAPTIELNYEAAPDQTTEIDRVSKVFSFGLPLKVEEVYRRAGFEKPEEGDEVLTQETSSSGIPGVPGASTLNPSVVPPEGAEGLDPSVPLAQATRRSLRLSRLSRAYFSGR